jgi:hypothetical protein
MIIPLSETTPIAHNGSPLSCFAAANIMILGDPFRDTQIPELI